MTTRSSTQKAAIVQNIQMIVEGQCRRPRRSTRLLKYTIERLETQSHRHGQVEVLQWISIVFTKSAEKLEKEMTHDLDVNLNVIMTYGKEDTAKELRNHAAETQDTWVDAVENTEVTEIEHAVCRALNELRAATTKGFDIKRRTIRL